MPSIKHLAALSLLVMLSAACSKEGGTAGTSGSEVKAAGAGGTSFPPIHVVREKLPLDLEGHVHTWREIQRTCFESKALEKNGGRPVQIPDSMLIAKEPLMKDGWREVTEEFFDGRKYAKLEQSFRMDLNTQNCQFELVKQRSAEYVNGCARTSISYAAREIAKSLDTVQAVCAAQAGAPPRVDELQQPPKGELKDLSSVGTKCILEGSGISVPVSTQKLSKEEKNAITKRAMAGDKQALDQMEEFMKADADAFPAAMGAVAGYPCSHAQYPYYQPLGNRPVILGWYPSEQMKKRVKDGQLVQGSMFTANNPNPSFSVRDGGFVMEPKVVEVGKPIPPERFLVPADTAGFAEK
jgi:hypothetical protein